MDDAWYRDRLSAYADNQLPLDERQAVDEHLARNAESRAILEQIVRFKQFADAHGDLDDTEYFEESARAIEQRLGLIDQPKIAHIARPRYAGLGWKIAAVAASIAVLTFIGLHTDQIGQMLRSSPTDQMSETPRPGRATDQARQIREQPAQTEQPAPAESFDVTTDETQKDNNIEANRLSGRIDEDSRAAASGGAGEVPPQSVPESADSEKLAVQKVPEIQSDRVAVDPDRRKVAAAAPKLERVPELTDSTPAKRAEKRTERTSAREQSQPGPLDQLSQAAQALTKQGQDASATHSLIKSRPKPADSGPVESEQSMDVWRARRDSLLPIYLVMTRDTSVSGRHAVEAAAKARLNAGEYSLPEVERELLDCWFNIARRSPAPAERDEARAALARYAERQAAHHAQIARDRLRLLDSLQTEEQK
jgi:hypothetical protein